MSTKKVWRSRRTTLRVYRALVCRAVFDYSASARRWFLQTRPCWNHVDAGTPARQVSAKESSLFPAFFVYQITLFLWAFPWNKQTCCCRVAATVRDCEFTTCWWHLRYTKHTRTQHGTGAHLNTRLINKNQSLNHASLFKKKKKSEKKDYWCRWCGASNRAHDMAGHCTDWTLQVHNLLAWSLIHQIDKYRRTGHMWNLPSNSE